MIDIGGIVYKSNFLIFGILLLLTSFAFSLSAEPLTAPKEIDLIRGNLYRVEIGSEAEADILKRTAVLPILRLNDGYLVLADNLSEKNLLNSGLNYSLIETDISRSELATDVRKDDFNKDKFKIVFEQDQVTLYRVDFDQVKSMDPDPQLAPILNEDLPIMYTPTRDLPRLDGPEMVDLDSLIAQISVDSLESYTERLQAFWRRPVLSDSNLASRDWIYNKMVGFGCDSVIIDTFDAMIYTLSDTCYNVIAYKIGSALPDNHIIIGAHRDAVDNSPGANDNGSGTAAVMEMARILKDVDTYSTIVFLLFDAEEIGLVGSWSYANRAAARGDSILFMLNLDMIAHKTNNSQANLFHGPDLTYVQLWQDLADSLWGIEGVLAGQASNSDHHPFIQNGYDAMFIHEYNFSTVYHSPQDSTSYMNFTYMSRLTQITMATAYVISQTYTPFDLDFEYVSGIPEFISPTQPTSFEVIVNGVNGGDPVDGSAQLHYSVNNGPYEVVPLTEISPDHYLVEMPTVGCFDKVDFYLSAEENVVGRIYETDDGQPHTTKVVAEVNFIVDDDFQSDLGWTVSGDASEGHWERGFPIGGGDRGDPPTDFDGSGNCYLTENVDGNSDVDGGYTNLISPRFDLSSGSGRISYSRWYSNYLGYTQDDIFRVYISNDDGQNWEIVETVGPDFESEGGWYERSFWAEDFIEPTGQMRLKFEASDLYMASTVEAGIDAVTIEQLVCDYYICGDANSDQEINISDGVYIINYVFTGGQEPEPLASADANCDQSVNVSDAVWIINYVFVGGNLPCDSDGDDIPDC